MTERRSNRSLFREFLLHVLLPPLSVLAIGRRPPDEALADVLLRDIRLPCIKA